MLGVLSFVTQFVSLGKEIPPVHYSYIPPLSFILPKEISIGSLNQSCSEVVISYVRLENFSDYVQKKIRIILNSPLIYDPVVRSDCSIDDVQYTFDKKRNEITIEKLDPQDAVSIDLYPDVFLIRGSFEPKVIINDKLLTRSMRMLGGIYKYPKMHVFMLLALLMAFGTILFSMHNLGDGVRGAFNGDWDVLREASSRFGACSMKVVNRTKREYEFEGVLYNPNVYNFLLRLNGVENYGDLLEKEKIVVCKEWKSKMGSQ